MPAAFVRVQLPAGRRCRRALFQDDRCFLRHSDAGSISPGGGCEGRSTHAARDSSASSPTPIVVLVWLRRSAGRRSWRECDTQPAPAFGRHTRHAPVTSIVWLVSGDVHGAHFDAPAAHGADFSAGTWPHIVEGVIITPVAARYWIKLLLTTFKTRQTRTLPTPDALARAGAVCA